MKHANPLSGPQHSIRRHHLIAAGILAAAVALLFLRLGNYDLWCDEAETAVFSQNVLKMGLPYGFDGRNLFENRNGIYLNINYVLIANPWLQFYVTALSYLLFGQNNFGSRALFSLAAAGAMVFQYLFVCRFFNRPRLALINLALMAGSAAFLLAGRQCRYYSLVMLGSTLAAWMYSRFRGKWHETLGVYLVFQLLYFSHELMAFACLSALAMSMFLFDNPRRAMRFFLPPLPFVALVSGCFIWWQRSVDHPEHPYMLRNILPDDFLQVFWLYIKDYNLTQLTPVVLMVYFVAALGYDMPRTGPAPTAIRRQWVVPAFLIMFTLITSILSPQASQADHSDIRYATVAYPFLLLLTAMAVDRIWQWRRDVGISILVLTIATNWLTLQPSRYYLAAFLREIALPFDNSVKVAVTFLNKQVRDDETVLVSPNYMSSSVAFYLRDRLLFCGVIGEDNQNLLAKGARLPPYTYSSNIQPDWIVGFGPPEMPYLSDTLSKLDLTRYIEHTFPIAGGDLTRPELFWRSFTPVTNVAPEFRLTILERADRLGIVPASPERP